MYKTVLLLFFILWVNNIRSQSLSPEVLSSAGETFVCPSTTINWTIGELAITTIQNSVNQITQGFHQSYYINGVDELPKYIGNIKVFPNPTSNWLSIEMVFNKPRIVRIQLNDERGKLIRTKIVSGKQITDKISILDLPVSTYFIDFQIDKGVYFQAIKILKTK